MNNEILKVIHILGIALIVTGLAALWGASFHAKARLEKKIRIQLALVHGIGMALVIISGFMLLGSTGMGGWVYGKFLIWLTLGGSMVLAKRKSHWGSGLLLLWVTLAGCAAWLALVKPF